ncbi:hypothetical protein, partial [Paraliomyxa miuraensis]|uniref:hypothetical protein n=1 Tax=Paraliomyxa miuraensis TaxID=376150 RepID=UPI0022568F05
GEDTFDVLMSSGAEGLLSLIPGGKAGKRLGDAVDAVADVADAAGDVRKATKGSDVFHVTPDGVALPKGPKHEIPQSYVQNRHRAGSYGEIVDGKFKERLRIDSATPAGRKGPNHSHYHLDGKGTHYSPAPGDKDPGFQP